MFGFPTRDEYFLVDVRAVLPLLLATVAPIVPAALMAVPASRLIDVATTLLR